LYVLDIGNRNYSSWSLRAWVLMRELALQFEERIHPFNPEGSSFETFREFSPSGRVPCLQDGQTRVWDSLAIAEYLAERHAGVWPGDDAARTWARCVSAEMHSGFATLRAHCPMCVGVTVRLHDVPGALARDLERIDEIWREGLDRFGGPWLAGKRFGAVDAMFAPVAFRLRGFSLALSHEAMAWADRVLDLDSIKAWESAALEEPWREPEEEDIIRAHAETLEDRRVPAAFTPE